MSSNRPPFQDARLDPEIDERFEYLSRDEVHGDFLRRRARERVTGIEVDIYTPGLSLRSNPESLKRLNRRLIDVQMIDDLHLLKPFAIYAVDLERPCCYFVERSTRPAEAPDGAPRSLVTLGDYIAENDLDADAGARLLHHMLLGLAALHNRGYMHANLSLDSVVLTGTGAGLAAQLAGLHYVQRPGRDLVLPKNPQFAAPELREPTLENVDRRADVYAVGMIAYHMLLGVDGLHSVFDVPADPSRQGAFWDNVNSMTYPIRRLDEVDPDMPHGLATIVQRLLEKNPDLRLADATAALELVTRYLGTPSRARVGRRTAAPPPPGGIRALLRRTPVRIAVAAGLVLMLGVSSFWVLRPRTDPALIASSEASAKQIDELRAGGIEALPPGSPALASFAEGRKLFNDGLIPLGKAQNDEARARLIPARDRLQQATTQAAAEIGAIRALGERVTAAARSAGLEPAALRPIDQRLDAGRAEMDRKQWRTAETAFREAETALAAASAEAALMRDAQGAIAAARTAQQTAAAAGAQVTPGFARGETLLRQAEEAMPRRAFAPARTAATGAQEAFRAAGTELATLRRQLAEKQSQLAGDIARLRQEELESHPRFAALIDAQRRGAAEEQAGQFGRAAERYDAALRLVQELDSEQQRLRAALVEQRQRLTETRNALRAGEAGTQPGWAELEQRYVASEALVRSAPAVQAKAALDRLAADYEQMKTVLANLINCALQGAPGRFTRLAAGSFTLPVQREGDDWQKVAAGQRESVVVAGDICIQLQPVSNRDLRRFLQSPAPDAQKLRGQMPELPDDDRPADRVTHDVAVAYARWLSAELRRNFDLPTAQEWQAGLAAARGRVGAMATAAFAAERRDWTKEICRGDGRPLSVGLARDSGPISGTCRLPGMDVAGQGLRLVVRR